MSNKYFPKVVNDYCTLRYEIVNMKISYNMKGFPTSAFYRHLFPHHRTPTAHQHGGPCCTFAVLFLIRQFRL